MNYWLIKSEPFKYSWDQLVADGRTHWDGVRNFQARNNLRSMKLGDRLFFYHSNEGLAIVGICEVVKEAYQDPTTEDPNWLVVDIAPVKALNNPVLLTTLKADSVLSKMAFVKQGRLSVSPVTEQEWLAVNELAG